MAFDDTQRYTFPGSPESRRALAGAIVHLYQESWDAATRGAADQMARTGMGVIAKAKDVVAALLRSERSFSDDFLKKYETMFRSEWRRYTANTALVNANLWPAAQAALNALAGKIPVPGASFAVGTILDKVFFEDKIAESQVETIQSINDLLNHLLGKPPDDPRGGVAFRSPSEAQKAVNATFGAYVALNSYLKTMTAPARDSHDVLTFPKRVFEVQALVSQLAISLDTAQRYMKCMVENLEKARLYSSRLLNEMPARTDEAVKEILEDAYRSGRFHGTSYFQQVVNTHTARGAVAWARVIGERPAANVPVRALSQGGGVAGLLASYVAEAIAQGSHDAFTELYERSSRSSAAAPPAAELPRAGQGGYFR